MKPFRRIEVLYISIIIYAGIALLVLRYFLFLPFSNIPYELFDTLGLLLLIIGTVWFFNERTNRRIDFLYKNIHRLNEQGINDIDIISTKNLSDLLSDISSSQNIYVLANYQVMDRNIFDFFDNLQRTHREITARILITGIISRVIEDNEAETIQELERRALLERLKYYLRGNPSITIRVSPLSDPQILLFSSDKVSVLFPYATEGKLLYLQLREYSEEAVQYRRYFDRIWDNSNADY